MGKLRIMSRVGDKTVVWDQAEARAGDVEAIKAVREAERIFQEQRASGATAFRVAPDTPAERLDRFDPEADQIVFVPRIVGG